MAWPISSSKFYHEFYSRFIQVRTRHRHGPWGGWRPYVETRAHRSGAAGSGTRARQHADAELHSTHTHTGPSAVLVCGRRRLACTCVSMCDRHLPPLEAHASRTWHMLGRLRTAPGPHASVKVRMAPPQTSCDPQVLLHLPDTLLDEAARQTPGGEVEAFLVRCHALILDLALGQDTPLDLIPEREVQGHEAGAVRGQCPRPDLLRLLCPLAFP